MLVSWAHRCIWPATPHTYMSLVFYYKTKILKPLYTYTLMIVIINIVFDLLIRICDIVLDPHCNNPTEMQFK